MAPRNGLVHLKEYDIKDSNVELIGSDIDHRVKYASAATEPAWHTGGIGKSAGLFVFRIEDFEVVPVPQRDYGYFYDGDSYIVLNSVLVGRDGDANQHLIHDIFFWLGAHTSQDEAGTAAYKTVELDEFLGGAATQHREVQASPSRGFLALFPRLHIRQGGVASGFRHVEEDKTPAEKTLTLLRVFKQPGVRTDGGIVVYEVAPSVDSLDDGDVFVLETDDTVWVWQGRNSHPMEKHKASEVAEEIKERTHKGGVEVVAQDDSRSVRVRTQLSGGSAASSSDSTRSGGYQSARPAISAPQNTNKQQPGQLWRLSDASGTLSFDLVKGDVSAVSLSDLDSNDVFLWDDGGREIWVWEGTGASRAERRQWLNVAQAYVRRLAASNEDAYLIALAKVSEGRESTAFLESIGGGSVAAY